MRGLKAELLRIVMGLMLVPGGILCLGSETAETETVPPPPAVVAHFHLNGVLTESPVVDPFGFTTGQVMSLTSLVDRLEQASNDDEVKAVVLTFDGMSFGFGQLEEVRAAIQRVQDAGKKVYVHAEGMRTFSYALLCAGGDLSVAPESALWLTGIYGESLYVKDLLSKIGILGDFMHMGAYKSAAEMLTRTEPSDPAKENVNWLLDGYYDALVAMIAESRSKTPDQVRDLIDGGPYLADEALEKGLIDAIETRDEFLARLRKDIEGPVAVDNRYGRKKGPQINLASPLALFSILGEMFKTPERSQKDAVAVVYVEGAILPGHSQPSPFGQTGGAYSGDIRKALETAAKDSAVKAVVLRVDSPGGSAEASEVILNATRQVRSRKPLIVSMGDIAGSGGYYVSCGADTIFADTATITASIGVVGGKLVTAEMWNKLGVNWVGYQRGANADILSSERPFDDAQRRLLERYMQDVYDVFKAHVAKGRDGKLTKDLDEIAGGRVFTGKQALELGLVDHLGGLHDAIEYAAAQVSLDDYEVRVIPEPQDFITMLMGQSSGESERPTDISVGGPAGLLTGHPALASLFDILRQTEPLRARALYQALQRVELIRDEGVVMMMPFDMVLR
ncbi:MAG: signal peptide peptidase SppA [Phycisphaerales bacterium]|nr:MAG: signal peptide peptidase SppA [Phycisphaerales bacterium]